MKKLLFFLVCNICFGMQENDIFDQVLLDACKYAQPFIKMPVIIKNDDYYDMFEYSPATDRFIFLGNSVNALNSEQRKALREKRYFYYPQYKIKKLNLREYALVHAVIFSNSLEERMLLRKLVYDDFNKAIIL